MIYEGSTQQLQASKLNFIILQNTRIYYKRQVNGSLCHLFYEQQHGFHPSPRMSCVTQLLAIHTMEH